MVAMRKDFVANASHELKTPITIIRGFAEALYDNPEFAPEKRKEITEKIVRNCGRMAAIIKDLLILSDIENLPSTRIVDTDLLELVERCRDMLLELHPQTDFKIKKDSNVDFHFQADPYFIELALTNLMVNAAKYSHEPAKITVTLDKNDENISISIADKGIGIAPKDQERIFQRFYTADKAHSRMKGGSGLGLSIVETIVEKHCGKISLESELGVGSTFTLTFPFANNQ
jgi:signal transduction histidine kinase